MSKTGRVSWALVVGLSSVAACQPDVPSASSPAGKGSSVAPPGVLWPVCVAVRRELGLAGGPTRAGGRSSEVLGC